LDALYANGPRIQEILDANMDFIITVKDNDGLVSQVRNPTMTGKAEIIQFQDKKTGTSHQYRFKNDIWLNCEFKHKVNYVEHFSYPKNGQDTHWSWITNIPITHQNAIEITKGGRARWRIAHNESK
jgi:hypothetical protein